MKHVLYYSLNVRGTHILANGMVIDIQPKVNVGERGAIETSGRLRHD